MARQTPAARLEAVELAIDAKIADGALLSYTHNGVTVQTESLQVLEDMRDKLIREVAYSNNSGMIIKGAFPRE